MAEVEEVEDNEQIDKSKEGQKAAAALDSVTDHVEEKEISGASKKLTRGRIHPDITFFLQMSTRFRKEVKKQARRTNKLKLKKEILNSL